MRISSVLAFLFLGLVFSGCDSGDASDNQGSGITQADIDALVTALGCSPVVSTSVGQTKSGSLVSGDCSHPNPSDDSRIDYFGFRLTSNTTVTIDMESSDFDAYLYLYNASGQEITFDDDSGGGFDARITRTLDAGLYALGANGFDASDLGSYTLEITN